MRAGSSPRLPGRPEQAPGEPWRPSREEGSFVVAEPCEGGVLIRPALVLPVEVYTPERKAQFLLSNTIDAADYAGAVAEVRRMGLDPETIPHYKPPGV